MFEYEIKDDRFKVINNKQIKHIFSRENIHDLLFHFKKEEVILELIEIIYYESRIRDNNILMKKKAWFITTKLYTLEEPLKKFIDACI
jgi:hypothetical protein